MKNIHQERVKGVTERRQVLSVFFSLFIFMETAESLTPISLRPKLRDSAGRGRGRGRGRNFNEGSGQVVDSYI